MTEPTDVRATRAAYDTVAVDYAELLSTALAAKPLDRALTGLPPGRKPETHAAEPL
jgi:hypothetical protein